MDKNLYSKLIVIAEDVLNDPNWECPLFNKSKDPNGSIIYESYNGQISSFGISILTIGIRPTISVYYQDAPQKGTIIDDAYRVYVLDVLARMLSLYNTDYKFKNAKDLCSAIINNVISDRIKTDLINCSIALKSVVRTYKMK